LMSRPCFIQRTASSELALYLGLDASNIIPHYFFFLLIPVYFYWIPFVFSFFSAFPIPSGWRGSAPS
jgi:hypothetical protein